MAIRGTARTLGADVYEQLRDRILNGDLTPETRLRPSYLRTEFNVSVSVVREALTRLAEQQLVVAEPNLGFAVASLTRKNLEDIVQARTEIEGFTVKLSVINGDLKWESALMAAHHTLEHTPMRLEDDTVSPAWNAAHAAFHAQLLDGCDNEQLLGICDKLFKSGELYRTWSDSVSVTVHRDAAAEHKELLRAAIDRQPERTAELLKKHIEKTRDLALEHIAALHARERATQPLD